LSNNRFNKPAPAQYAPKEEKKKTEEVKLVFKPCCNCGKTITDGYYSHWGDGGACSKTCDISQSMKRNDYGYPYGELWRES